MNKNFKKHSEILAKVLLKLKESEKDEFIDAYTKVLAQKKLLLYYPQIVSEILKIIKKEIQKNTVSVYYKNFIPEISNKLKKVFGNDVLMEESLDQSLISGIVINFHNKKIDASIKGRLKMIKSNINN